MTKVTRRDFLTTAAIAPAVVAAAARQARQGRRPNLLYLLPDQWRFDWLSGNPELPIHTPNIDALASRGIRFTKASVASPLCAPSRACLATAAEYDLCGVGSNSNDFPTRRDTYYKRLQAAGYWVAGCGKLDLAKRENNQGVDGRRHMEEWGLTAMINNAGKGDAIARNGADDPHDPYMAYLKRLGLSHMHADDFARRRGEGGYTATFPTALSDEAYCDNWVGRTGLDLMKQFPAGQPWHLVVNFVGPHDPEDITVRMEKTVRDRRFRQPNASTQYAPDVHNAIRQNYTAMVENLDRWVGIYMDELKRRGELDNTLVVFSSDHGEMLGDHDRWGKRVPYEASLCVPLVVAGPDVKGGQRSDALVSHIDIGATFLDYGGGSNVEGQTARSIRPLLQGRAKTHRDYISAGLLEWRLVHDQQYKLVRGFENETKLFDVLADPFENTNIAAKAPDIVARMSKLLPPPNPEPDFNRQVFGTGRGGR